jgi:Transglutaminase-like superfamily
VRKLRLAAEIVVEYVRAGRDLRRDGLRAALAAVPRPSERDDPLEHETSVRMGRAVDRTLSCLPSDPRCLIRAIVLARVLARHGIGSRLVLGVQSVPDFTAHAWVEHRGLPLLPAGDYQRGRLAEF